MTTNSNTADDAIFDGDYELADVDTGAVGVAAVRTPSAPVPARACWAVMENYAALITEATPMRALPLPLTQNEPATVAARISQLPSRVAAVFLIGLNPSGAGHVQRAMDARCGPPVISELDVVTAALSCCDHRTQPWLIPALAGVEPRPRDDGGAEGGDGGQGEEPGGQAGGGGDGGDEQGSGEVAAFATDFGGAHGLVEVAFGGGAREAGEGQRG